MPGRVETYFGYVGLGLFRLDETRHRLVFVAPQSDDLSEDVEAALRSDARFDREEDVRGQRALVMRAAGADDAAYTEEFHAPALGGLLVKRVEHSPIRREVWEPTSVEFGEPSASLFTDLDRYELIVVISENIRLKERPSLSYGNIAGFRAETFQRLKPLSDRGIIESAQ